MAILGGTPGNRLTRISVANTVWTKAVWQTRIRNNSEQVLLYMKAVVLETSKMILFESVILRHDYLFTSAICSRV